MFKKHYGKYIVVVSAHMSNYSGTLHKPRSSFEWMRECCTKDIANTINKVTTKKTDTIIK